MRDLLINKNELKMFFFLFFRFMATHLYFLLVLTVLILPIECNSDLYSVLNTDDGHLSEPPAYKYSEQGNIEPFLNMSESNLLNNNIFISILSINLIPILLLFFFIPITILRRYKMSLTIFLSFTSGGLLANVFLRLIPYIIETKKNVQHQHENHMGLCILTGVFLSFIIEKFIRNFQSMYFIFNSLFFLLLKLFVLRIR